MNLYADSWLVNFVEEDIPSMSATEIVHRLVALRDIENSPHFMYAMPVRNEASEWYIQREPEDQNGYTRLHIDWLMEELHRRGLFSPDSALS